MRLLSIEARDWLSYPVLSLDFSDVQQVVITGPNGHGKSALLDAIRYSLYGDGRSSPDSMIAQGALSTWVETIWDMGGKMVRVTRKRSIESRAGATDLQLSVDGTDVTRHTIAETQAAIEKLIGLDSGALMATAFMLQGDHDAIMGANPARRKDILVELLGLQRYEDWHAHVSTKRIEAAASMLALSEQADALEAMAAKLPDAEKAVAANAKSLAAMNARVEAKADEATRLREKVAVYAERQGRLRDIEKSIADAQSTLDRESMGAKRLAHRIEEAIARASEAPPRLHAVEPASSVTIADVQRWEEARQSMADWKGQLSLVNANLERHARDMETAASVPCHGEGIYATCRFLQLSPDADTWVATQRQAIDALIELEAMEDPRPRLEEERASMRDYDVAKAEYEAELRAHQRNVRTAEDDVPILEREKEKTEAAMRVVGARITELQKERLRLQQDQLDYTDLKGQVLRVAAALDGLRDLRDDANNALQNARVDERGYRAAAEALPAHRARIEQASYYADLWTVLQQAFHRNGIPTMLLENAIPQIESRANAVLEKMPGGFGIEIVTQQQTKTSGLRETLDVIVTVDGVERAYDLLSGGERFRVDFALRIALAGLLTHRTGTTIDTLWLDEPLANLDRVGRDGVIDTLLAVADDFPLIVVVSHHDESSDRFPARIIVAKSGAASEAVLS